MAALERRVERLETVMRSVEHDLRGALFVGTGYLEVARTDPDPEHFDRVEHSHERIEALLEDLRVTAAPGEADRDRRPVDVEAMVREAWTGIESAGATLIVEGTPTVVANDARLLRMLENLLRNAVQHGTSDRASSDRPATGETGRGGHQSTAGEAVASGQGDPAIELLGPAPRDESVSTNGAGRASPTQLTVTVGALDQRGFFVADDGPGIPADVADRIFEPGYTSSETGTGLGLAIVSDVADEHGWTVRATDSETGGARFEVTDVDTPDGSATDD